jgi:hypothetical protein
MSTRSIVTGLLLLLAVGGIVYVLAGGRKPAEVSEAESAQNGDQTDSGARLDSGDGLPSNGVVVYYFHGRQRCYTCNKMEALADGIIFERFSDYLRDGWVVFKSVDIQTAENSHFAHEYELRSAGIVMVERQDGRSAGWRRLDEVWTKIRDEEQYKDYIADNLTECLRDIGLEKS